MAVQFGNDLKPRVVEERKPTHDELLAKYGFEGNVSDMEGLFTTHTNKNDGSKLSIGKDGTFSIVNKNGIVADEKKNRGLPPEMYDQIKGIVEQGMFSGKPRWR